jgi:hypothetical protein
MEFRKFFRRSLISFVFICSTAANAGTVLMPTDGDVNFFVNDPFPYTLAIFDDTDFGGTSLEVILGGLPLSLLGGTITFSTPTLMAENENGDTLTFTGGNTDFMVGLWGGTSWHMDDGNASIIPSGNAVALTYTVGEQVLTVDVAVVPVPAAVWLFGSGLLGLVGIARRRRS